MPPKVEGWLFSLPEIPFFFIKDPLGGRFSKSKFWAFFSDPHIDLSDPVLQANLLARSIRNFGLGGSEVEAGADLIAQTSCPIGITESNPVVARCIKALPQVFRCCSSQQIDFVLCHANECNADATDFALERNLYHLHVWCKSCMKRCQLKFQDKDFAFIEKPGCRLKNGDEKEVCQAGNSTNSLKN